jgi:2,3-bisphosphoglycerate-independent phosphoglycerate mutase
MSDRGFPLVTLVILDGWGLAPAGPGNAVELAETPIFDGLWTSFPHTTLAASGEAVGLPEGQMGNSEVGHLTIGSGRVLFQDLMRVNVAVRDGSLFENPVLCAAFARARERGGNVHLMGLVSRGGVHSHIDHLLALLELAEREGMAARTWIHAFTDGRDVSPHAAVADLARLPAASIATVVGRYYAMDRDNRAERTERAVAAILDGEGERASDPVAAVAAGYERGATDEFVEPIVFPAAPRLEPATDSAVFFNFRPDRGRQLSRRLLERGVDLTTMTRYAEDIATPVAFPEQHVGETLAETLSAAGIRQLHAAETEKYAHVTYFFNGGEEAEWAGETRVLVASPRDVASYDLKPEMSAAGVADEVVRALPDGYGFCIVNFANPDMVGHTGVIPAVVRAVGTADAALGRVIEATAALGGVCLVTADHGNAEQMLEADGVSPHTAHTTNPVPLVLTMPDARLRDGGSLADLAPTVLELLGQTVPEAMTGRSLVVRMDNENR